MQNKHIAKKSRLLGFCVFFFLIITISAVTVMGAENNTILPRTNLNLLTNAGFEIDDFGKITYWSETELLENKWYLTQDNNPEKGLRWAEPVDLAPVPGGKHYIAIQSVDGSYCDAFCDTSVLQLVSAKEGITYKLSAYAHRTAGQGGSLYLDFLNSQKNRLQVKTAGAGGQNYWRQTSVTATAPEKTEYIRVILYTDNSVKGIIYWDNIRLEAL